MKKKYVDYLYGIYKTSFGLQLFTPDPLENYFAPIARPSRRNLTVLTPSPETLPTPVVLEKMRERLDEFLDSTFEMLKRIIYEDIITKRLNESFSRFNNKSSNEILHTFYQGGPMYLVMNLNFQDIDKYEFINPVLGSRANKMKSLIKEAAEFRDRIYNLIKLKTMYN
tara:strand:- start:1112 stop:1615 length:504 start_codon:yes stop_codon:yes gene_type:complete